MKMYAKHYKTGEIIPDALIEKMQKAGNVFPDKQTLVEDFEFYMKRHREAFTQQEFKDRLDLGGTVLVNYYDFYVQQWNKIVATEYRITNIMVNDIQEATKQYTDLLSTIDSMDGIERARTHDQMP